MSNIWSRLINLAGNITGILGDANGGTGVDSSAFTGVAKVSAGVWSAATVVNADVSGAAAIDGSKLVSASASVPGVVTTGTQTIAGAKTFQDAATFQGTGGTVAAGSYTAAGAWTIGPNASVSSATIQNNTTSLYALAVKNLDSTSSSDGQHAMFIQKGSTTNTTSQLFLRFLINGGGTASGQINANGASAAAFGTSSDLRLKEDIVGLGDELSRVLALRPVEFSYKDGSGRQVGFIAQDMAPVYPDAVAPDDGGMLVITGWDKTSARIVRAMQQMAERIERLEKHTDSAGIK